MCVRLDGDTELARADLLKIMFVRLDGDTELARAVDVVMT